MNPITEATLRPGMLRSWKANSTDIMNYPEVNAALAPTFQTPHGFVDMCLSTQDNRESFRAMWGKPHFVMNLEYKTSAYQFKVNNVTALVWTSKKGTSIEIVGKERQTDAVVAGLLLRHDIVSQLREWMPKHDLVRWARMIAAIKPKTTSNVIHIIEPYRWKSMWVFDDEAKGLDKEPFVSGIDTMLDLVTKSIPGAEKGFICLFSESPFPDASLELTWVRGDKDNGGNWYLWKEMDMEGWLCPALFRYFESAPNKIYGAFRPKTPIKTNNHEKATSRKRKKLKT